VKILFVLNDPPYGTELCYNALRLANALSKREGTEVRVFLFGDAAACAKSGQIVPTGFYNLETMLRSVARRASVAACGTCMDARGIGQADLTEGVSRGTLDQLADWTEWADKIAVF